MRKMTRVNSVISLPPEKEKDLIIYEITEDVTLKEQEKFQDKI